MSVNERGVATRLSLIVHAETAATRRGAFANGESLTPRGRIATRATGPLASLPDRVSCSPAPAAVETVNLLGYQPVVDDALNDLNAGSWRGLTLAEVGPADAAAWLTDVSFGAHGGESLEALFSRTGAWLRDQARRSSRTVAVTHASVVRAAVVVALDATPSLFWRIETVPLSIVTLGSDGRRWTLRELIPLSSSAPRTERQTPAGRS